jgi:hypothetical protein
LVVMLRVFAWAAAGGAPRLGVLIPGLLPM